MAGLGGAIGAFVAGDPAGAYQQSRKRSQQVDQGDVDAQAQAAAGNAYMGMFGGQQTPGQMPGGQPGAPPQGPTQQQGGMLATLLQRLRGAGGGMGSGVAGAPPSQPMMPPPGPGGGQMPGPGGPSPGQPPMGAPQPQMGGMPQQGAVPGARPMGPPQGPQMGGGMPMGPQGGGPPGQPQRPQGGQPGMPQLGWQQIVQSVVRANPGVKDPRVIAAAVDKFIPLMNSQSLAQWREMQSTFRGYNAETSRERADTAKEQGEERIEQAGQRIQQGDRRLDQGDKREERLGRAQILKADQQHTMQDLARERLGQQIMANKDRTQLGQWRALLDAQHKRATEIITSAGGTMDPKERKKLLAEEDEFYTGKIKEMQGAMDAKPREEIMGGGTGDGKPVKTETIAKPATKVKTPEEAAKLAPGTKYVTPDGTEYTR